MRDSIPSRAQGASSSPSNDGAPSQRFQAALAIAAEQRQRRIRSELEPSITGAFSDGEGQDGFLPAAQAAAVMGVSEPELAQLAARGLLEYRDYGGGLVWVRPAIVSVAAVRDERP